MGVSVAWLVGWLIDSFLFLRVLCVLLFFAGFCEFVVTFCEFVVTFVNLW